MVTQLLILFYFIFARNQWTRDRGSSQAFEPNPTNSTDSIEREHAVVFALREGQTVCALEVHHSGQLTAHVHDKLRGELSQRSRQILR